MFSGIIETLGQVIGIDKDKTNINFEIQHNFNDQLYIDQSIAHDGCCLTVVEIDEVNKRYQVTAIEETLSKTRLADWNLGTLINLERCIQANARLDGHFVQGHVDTTTECINVEDKNGSWVYTFDLPTQYFHLVVDKGSIAINGTSLTLILDESSPDKFQVAIIPYTYEHTNFHRLSVGDKVNIEFDVLGKYIARLIKK
jgi:riboflavin synthase